MKLGQISFLSFLSQILASVVGFVATVAITQTLGSGVFGTYALIVAVVIWLKILATMGIRSAVIKHVSEGDEVGQYATAGGIFLVGVLSALTLLLFALHGRVDAYVGREVTGWIVALTWAGATLAYTRAILQGRHLVHYAAALKPLDRVVRSVVQIAAVVLTLGLAGILLGYGVGAVVAAAAGLVLVVDVRPRRPRRRHFRDLFEYARFSWLSRLSSRTFTSMDTIVLGAFVSVGLIGIYEVAWNLASMLAIFGTAIGQTMFPEMSKVASEEGRAEVQELLERALAYAGLFLIPGLAGAALVGDLILQVYGGEFSRGHVVLVLLVGSRLVYAYAEQLLTTLNGLDRPDLGFRVNAAFVAVNLVLNVVLVWQFSWLGAAVATLTSSAVSFAYAYWSTYALLDGFGLPTTQLGKQLAAAVLMSAVVYALRQAVTDSLAVGVALTAVGGLTYFLALAVISRSFRITVRENLPLDEWWPPAR